MNFGIATSGNHPAILAFFGALLLAGVGGRCFAGDNLSLLARYDEALDACMSSAAKAPDAESADRVLADMLAAAPVEYVEDFLGRRERKSADADTKAACRILIARIRELQSLFDQQAVHKLVENALRQRRVQTLCASLLVRPRGELQVAAAHALAEIPESKSVQCLVCALERNSGGIAYGGAAAWAEQVKLQQSAIASLRVITGEALRQPENPADSARGAADIGEDVLRAKLIHLRQENASRCREAIQCGKKWLAKHRADTPDSSAD